MNGPIGPTGPAGSGALLATDLALGPDTLTPGSSAFIVLASLTTTDPNADFLTFTGVVGVEHGPGLAVSVVEVRVDGALVSGSQNLCTVTTDNTVVNEDVIATVIGRVPVAAGVTHLVELRWNGTLGRTSVFQDRAALTVLESVA